MQENKLNSLGSLVYSRQEYATKQFWDSRYKQTSTYFDWYAEFPQLKQTFETQYSLNTSHHILMLGCGNSKLSQQMYEAGYHNIVNIDISPAVIQKMSQISEQRGYNKMKWLVMDATDMKQISNKTFDAVIDKGTLDALISGKNNQICQKMLQQTMRVLKKDGQFILITYGSPEGRRKFFQKAIGLTKYDYYFTKVDLSSMSTLINLMRSNLGNKPLSTITKDAEAMKKSLMEYNLIKVLRRNRKNQKKYIIWHDIIKQAISKPQQQYQNKQISPKEQQHTSQVIKQENHQKNLNQNEPTKQQQKKQNKTSYNPKKQSFCYVYSIKQKFAIQLQQTLKQKIQQQTYPHYQHTKNQDGSISVYGDNSLQKICIFAQGCQQELDKAITYLQLQNISNNPLIIYEQLQKYKACKQRIKLHCKQGNHYYTPALSKSVYQIQFVVNDNRLENIQQRLRKVCRQLVENGGLQVHPSPHSYAYVGILMQKINPKSKYSQFLNKYWYPTYKLISYSKNTAIYHISVTPILPQNYWLKTISQSLKSEQSTKSIKNIHTGYLNYFDPKIINIMNYCVMNYSEKINSCLVLQQFRQISNKYEEQYRDNVIYIKKQCMAMILARIISAI